MKASFRLILLLSLLSIPLIAADCGQAKPSFAQSILLVKLPLSGVGDEDHLHYLLRFDRIKANEIQRQTFVIYNRGTKEDILIRRIELTDDANGVFSLATVIKESLVLQAQEEAQITITLLTKDWGKTYSGKLTIIWEVKGSSKQIQSTVLIDHK